SDHRCINTVLNLDVPSVERESRLQWRKADWAAYCGLVEKGWEALDLYKRAETAGTRQELDVVVQDMTNVLTQAAEAAVPLSKPSPFAKRWWTSELTAQQRTLKHL
ncbi:hypothetical protein C8Q79DRAFT_868716, partial [Trametes meyenii]